MPPVRQLFLIPNKNIFNFTRNVLRGGLLGILINEAMNNLVTSTLFIKVNFLYLKQRIVCVFFPNGTVTANFRLYVYNCFFVLISTYSINVEWIIEVRFYSLTLKVGNSPLILFNSRLFLNTVNIQLNLVIISIYIINLM